MHTSTHVGSDAVARLKLEGEIDLQVKEELATTLRTLIAADHQGVIVEVHEVTFLDSSGIGVLVQAYQQAEAAGKSFRVAGPQDMVLRVLEVTGVATLLTTGTPDRTATPRTG